MVNETRTLTQALEREVKHQDAGAAIEVLGLAKAFGSFEAVSGLHLCVGPGKIFGLLGPNGAGKTTSIRCITGLIDPTAGEVRLLGERLTSSNVALKRRLGIMPDFLGLFDQLYAYEFLLFHAAMFGLRQSEAVIRVNDLLQRLDLAETTSRRLADLSTGMRKKVSFAAAILHSPDILFLDEPFDGIDPGGTAMLKLWLHKFAANGRTVFMASHALDTVERLCDEVAIICRGRLAWQGALPRDGAGELMHQNRTFATLEELFLSITQSNPSQLDWL